MFVCIFLTNLYGQSQTITIIPLGNVDNSLLKAVGKSIDDFYGYDCVIGDKQDVTPDLLSRYGTKYDANKILNKFGTTGHVLIISEYQVIILERGVIETSVWGLANCPGRVCLASIYHLNSDSTELFYERVSKVCLHEVGHNIGYKHCTTTYKCIMNEVTRGLRELDGQEIWMCDDCKK